MEAPAPDLVLGGPNLSESWSVSSSWAYVNGGTPVFAIRFDHPIDPASIVPGVNLTLSMCEDLWWDPWHDIAFDCEYDAATMTLSLFRKADGNGQRGWFSGNFYRITLNGEGETPLRGEGPSTCLGQPLGADADHPNGRIFQIQFMLDDGVYGSKFDVPAGPAPTAHFVLIDPTPIPIPLSTGDESSARTTNTAPPTPSQTPLPSGPTVRLELGPDLRAIYSAFTLPPANHANFNFAAPLSVAPVGGDRGSPGASGAPAGERIDLGFLGGDNGKTAANGASPTPVVWRHVFLFLYSWIENLVVTAVVAPTVDEAMGLELAPLAGVSSPSRGVQALGLLACAALFARPGLRTHVRRASRSRIDARETRA